MAQMLRGVTLLCCSVELSIIFFKLWSTERYGFPYRAFMALCGSIGAFMGIITKGRPLFGFVWGVLAGVALSVLLPLDPVARE